MIESFFFDESEYYSYIRNISLKRFEYSNIIRIIQLYLNKMWKIKSRKQDLRKHIQKAHTGIK